MSDVRTEPKRGNTKPTLLEMKPKEVIKEMGMMLVYPAWIALGGVREGLQRVRDFFLKHPGVDEERLAAERKASREEVHGRFNSKHFSSDSPWQAGDTPAPLTNNIKK